MSWRREKVEEKGGGGCRSRASANAVVGEAGGGVSLGREIGRKEIKFCPVFFFFLRVEIQCFHVYIMCCFYMRCHHIIGCCKT